MISKKKWGPSYQDLSVDVVIPTFNASQLFRGLWRSLKAKTEHAAQYIITDDASPESDLQQQLREIETAQELPVIVNRNIVRTGFPANCNKGASLGTGQLIVFLNADTRATKGWLQVIVDEFLTHDETGIVGCRLLYPHEKSANASGRIQHAGVARNRDGAPYHIYRTMQATDPKVMHRREINAVTGAVLAIRRELFEDLQGFDKVFAYGQYEDIDLCWRARTLEWNVVYVPEVMLYHYEHGSGEQYVGQTSEKNRKRLFDRWGNLGSDEGLFGEDTDVFDRTNLSAEG